MKSNWRYIEEQDFDKLYETYSSSYLTYYFLNADIDPVTYMDHIPDFCFFGLDIANYEITSNIKAIGANAFNRCTSLQEIYIPNSVINIGDTAFWDCTKLSKVTIPKKFKDECNVLFNCNLNKIEFIWI